MSAELKVRYRGTLLGFLWPIVSALLMLIVYTFFFGTLLGLEWSGLEDVSSQQYALIIYAGLSMHAILSEVIGRAPHAILSKPNFIKKIRFPVVLLPISVVAVAFFQGLISILMLIIASSIWGFSLNSTFFWVVFVLVGFFVLCVGIAMLLASFSVFLRDLSQLSGFISTALLFISPIFYSVEALPNQLKFWIFLNPLTVVVESLRSIIIFNSPPNLFHCVVYFATSCVVLVMACLVFDRLKSGFSDAL